MKKIIVSSLFIYLIFFVCPITAAENPIAYITEEAISDYHTNGSLGNLSITGFIEVEVPNTDDVLQYIRLNLSGVSGTNLQSVTAYRAVAASPNTGDRVRVYVSTSESIEDISYVITDSSPPLINLKLDYLNSRNGIDIYYNDTNTFLFNLTLNSTSDMPNATLVVQVAKDSYNTNDATNLSQPEASNGSVEKIDTDSDGYYDRIYWHGDLTRGEEVVINFNAAMTPGVNFDENDMYVNPNKGYGITSSFSSNQTLTGIIFTDVFSRGPVREGIDMLLTGGVWKVRGFIKNVAKSLIYLVHKRELYKVGEETPLISSTEEGVLNPGETENTNWYVAGGAKDYYTTLFDWEVLWNDSIYSGSTESRMYLPVLYGMDIWTGKEVWLSSPAGETTEINVEDRIRHLGHSNIEMWGIEINSTIHRLSLENVTFASNVSNVSVYYSNSTGTYDITANLTGNITTKNATADEDGIVFVSITNIADILGHHAKQNEDIILSYKVSASTNSLNKTFKFSGNATVKTVSGTPITKEFPLQLITPPVKLYTHDEVTNGTENLSALPNATKRIEEIYGVSWSETKDEFLQRTEELIETGDVVIYRVINVEEEKSNITTVFENNGDRDLENVVIIEEIPKSIAESIENVTFDTAPDTIVSSDPVVIWNLERVAAGEKIYMIYYVNKKITEAESLSYTSPGILIGEFVYPVAVITPSAAPAAVPIYHAQMITDVETSFVGANIVNVVMTSRVSDFGSRGIDNITLIIHVPERGDLDFLKISLKLYNNTLDSWQTLGGDDFLIVDRGRSSIGENYYKIYAVKKRIGNWHLYNNDIIELNYQIILPFGTHYLLNRISGYNFYENKIMFEDVYSPIRIARERVGLEPVETKESLEQGKMFVGKPGVWIKTIEAYNPNSVPVEETFNTYVFPGALNVYLIDDGDKKQLDLRRVDKNLYVSWTGRIESYTRNIYIIEIVTPPVLEVKREADVLESSADLVRFIINVTLKNSASEAYHNISFEFPIEFEKIIEITDGARLNYTEYDETNVLIRIPKIENKATKNVIIIYKEKPPTLILNLDRTEYPYNSTVNVNGILVPNERIEGSHLEMEVTGPKPNLETIYAGIHPLGKLVAGEKIRFSRTFNLPHPPPGKYSVDIRFRKDIWDILSAQKEFYVIGPAAVKINRLWFILAIIVFATILVMREKLKSKIGKRYAEREAKGRLWKGAAKNILEYAKQKLKERKKSSREYD